MKKQKSIMYFLLISLVLLISVGYAILLTNLEIDGTAEIHDAWWNIHFENYEQTDNSTITPASGKAPIISGTNTTEISYEVEFNKPGDVYEFTVDIVNGGTIDAMVHSIQTKLKIGNEEEELLTSSNTPSYMNYSVTYSDGAEIESLHELKAEASETILVRVEFKKDITNADVEEITKNPIKFTLELNYIQADNTAKPVEHARYIYTVNFYDSNAEGKNMVWLNQPLPDYITEYSTAAEAINNADISWWKNNGFCIKHKVVNGIVTESYAVILVTQSITLSHPLAVGEYELRGEKTDDKPSDYTSFYYETNKVILQTAFNFPTNPSVACDDDLYDGIHYYSCGDGLGLRAEIDEKGYVCFNNTDFDGCAVNSDGSSYCGTP